MQFLFHLEKINERLNEKIKTMFEWMKKNITYAKVRNK